MMSRFLFLLLLCCHQVVAWEDFMLAHDCQSLYRFGFVSTNAADRAGWNALNVSNATWCCGAAGVQCSAVDSRFGQHRVTSLNLPGLSICGTIDAVADLTLLTELDLNTNQLSGAIDAVANLTQLTVLSLYENALNGTIDAVANLTQLILLDLDTNELSGTMNAVANLTQLTRLALDANKLSGTIDHVANLTQLTILSLYINQLSGTFDAVANLTQLTILSLHTNHLCGTIDVVANFTQLILLDLGKNELSGTIDAVANLTRLTQLVLDANKFSGTIDAVANFTQLTQLDLDANQLSGTMNAVANLTKLTVLALAANKLTGTIDAVANLTQLIRLDLDSNLFTGTIDAVANLKQLTQLDLDTNHFSGTVDAVANLRQLTVLSLYVNQLSGTIDAVAHLTQLTQLVLHTNHLTGTIDALANLTLLSALALDSNQFFGSLRSLTELGATLQTVNLSVNQFDSLGLPLSVFTVASSLNFSHNHFHGVSLSASRDTPNVASPVVLDISGNAFLCPFPVWPERVVFLHSACVYPLATYALYGGVGAAALLVVGVLWVKRDMLWQPQKTSGIQVGFPLAWLKYAVWLLFIWFSLVNDSVATAGIIRHVLSPQSYCHEVNNPQLFASQVGSFTCEGRSYPYGDSFSAFVHNLQALDSTACGPVGAAEVQFIVIDPFIGFCRRFPSCGYVSAPVYACEQTMPGVIAYQGHHGFYVAVLCVIVIRAAYIGVSLAAVWWMSQFLRSVGHIENAEDRDSRGQFWLYDVASQSFFAPLAVLSVPAGSRAALFRWAVVEYRVTAAELYRRLWLSAVWYQLPHLVMTTYYALRVVETGLDDLGVLSVVTAAVAVCITFGRASWRWWEDRNGKDKRHLSLGSSASRMENMTAREYTPLVNG